MDELDESCNLKDIKKLLETNSITQGDSCIHLLYNWNHEDYRILCYGYVDGEAGSENKHDLPPAGIKKINTLDESDTQLLFGDIFILKKTSRLCDFDISDYGTFYSVSFGGFDDCDDSDDSDDSAGSLDNFIIDDNKEDSESDYTLSDEDLDIDETEY